MNADQPLFELSAAWQAAFWCCCSLWWAMELWIFARDRRSARGRSEDRGSRTAIVVLYYMANGLAFAAAYLGWGIAIPGPPRALLLAAFALILGGAALRLWSVLTLGRFFRTAVFVQDDHELISRGPYRVLRNPSYSGVLASMSGLGLALGNWLSLVAAVGFPLLGFVWRICVEEASLRRQFGDAYTAYARRRWALIPLVW
jgi:protein-S-isoprenylcysteine O-methyltransferase